MPLDPLLDLLRASLALARRQLESARRELRLLPGSRQRRLLARASSALARLEAVQLLIAAVRRQRPGNKEKDHGRDH